MQRSSVSQPLTAPQASSRCGKPLEATRRSTRLWSTHCSSGAERVMVWSRWAQQWGEAIEQPLCST